MINKLKKYYGQHLLSDSSYINKMIKIANLSPSADILEIGPGTGYLTSKLLPVVRSLTAVEIDRDFTTVLSSLKNQYNEKFELVFGDIMELSLREVLKKDVKYTVFANIPYYITSPIIELLLNNRHLFDAFFLTVQKEVAQRICAPEGSRERSAFSFFVDFYAKCNYEFDIPKEAFAPPPKVDSAFISLALRTSSKSKLPFDKIRPFITAAFSQRRKTVRNSLASLLRTNCDTVIENAGINPLARAENLSFSDFEKIYFEAQKFSQ